MKRFFKTREFQIPDGSTKITDKNSDAVAYLYADSVGRPCARVFYGKQNQPVLRCYFRTLAQREASVKAAFDSRQRYAARKAEQRAERKAWVPDYKVGEILHTNWGYDQTNVEYFEIIEIKGKYAILRELAQERTATGHMQGNCVPLSGQYLKPRYEGDDAGLPIRRLMQEHGIKIDDVRTGFRARTQIVAGIKVHQPIGWSAYH